MAVKTSVNYVATNDDGKKIQKTLTSINPKATGAEILEFTQSLNAMSTNTYAGTSRIEKRDLVPKTTATLEISEVAEADACSWAKFSQAFAIPLDTNSDAIPYVKQNKTICPTRIFRTAQYVGAEGTVRWCIVGRFDNTNWVQYKPDARDYDGAAKITKVGEIIVAVDETENFTGAECTITIYE